MTVATKSGMVFNKRRTNVSKRVPVSKELKKIYQDARKEGIWLREFIADKGFLVAAGSMRELVKIEIILGKKIVVSQLTLGDCVNFAVPGSGSTREKAYRDAIKEFKKSYRQTQNGWIRK